MGTERQRERNATETAPKFVLTVSEGHLELMEQLEAAEAKLPGLWVCGNYRSGVAFPDCVTFGYDHAKVVERFLASTKPEPSESAAHPLSSSGGPKQTTIAPARR